MPSRPPPSSSFLAQHWNAVPTFFVSAPPAAANPVPSRLSSTRSFSFARPSHETHCLPGLTILSTQLLQTTWPQVWEGGGKGGTEEQGSEERRGG